MSRFAMVRRALAVLLLALWWGGFSFYAGRVVFIGHEVLRSKIRQGFITERVTTELNWLALAALAVAGWELLARRPSTRRAAWFCWIVALLSTAALFALHSKMAGMLDFTARQITDDAHFYQWHRVYLLFATVQWLAVAVLGLMFHFTTWPMKLSKADAG